MTTIAIGGRIAPAVTRAARLVAAALLLGGMLAGTAAPAAASVTTFCPGTAATTDREFSLTTAVASECLAWGTGNITGNPANGDRLFGILAERFGAGHVLIDKSDDTTSGRNDGALGAGLTSGLSGSFSFTLPGAPTGQAWTDIVLGFKSGEGRLDPDWAAFILPAGITSGSWTISGQQALSHVNLYGRLVDVAPIPLPAAGWLLVGGVAALAGLRRRRACNTA